MAYIKLEDAINHIMNHTPVSCSADFFEGQMDCVSQLKSLPAADVVEVKHGEWIKVGKTESGANILQCSVCGKVRRGIAKTAYCKDCGAKMDGRSDQ